MLKPDSLHVTPRSFFSRERFSQCLETDSVAWPKKEQLSILLFELSQPGIRAVFVRAADKMSVCFYFGKLGSENISSNFRFIMFPIQLLTAGALFCAMCFVSLREPHRQLYGRNNHRSNSTDISHVLVRISTLIRRIHDIPSPLRLH